MKNIYIEAWRFIFSLYIVIYHVCGHVYGIRSGGYISVDVFFIISGYLLAYVQIEKNRSPIQYLKGRFLRLFPMYIIAFVIAEILNAVTHTHTHLRKRRSMFTNLFPRCS